MSRLQTSTTETQLPSDPVSLLPGAMISAQSGLQPFCWESQPTSCLFLSLFLHWGSQTTSHLFLSRGSQLTSCLFLSGLPRPMSCLFRIGVPADVLSVPEPESVDAKPIPECVPELPIPTNTLSVPEPVPETVPESALLATLVFSWFLAMNFPCT